MMRKILQVFLFVVIVFRCRSFILRQVDILIDIDETVETDINNTPDIDETLETDLNNKPDIIILDNYPDDLEPELAKTNFDDDVNTDDSDDIDPNLDLEIYDDEKMSSNPVMFSNKKSDELSLEAVHPTCQCLPSGESCTIKINSKTVNITVSRNDTIYVPRLIVKLYYSGEMWTQYFTVMQTPDVSHTFTDNVEISVQVGFKGLGEACLYLSKPFTTKLGCCKLLGSGAISGDISEPKVDSELNISELDKTKSEIVNGSKTSPMDDKVMGDKVMGDKVMDHKVIECKVMDHKVMDHKAMDDKVMDHKVMDHKTMDDKVMDDKVMDHKAMDHKAMDHIVMDHKVMDHKAMDHKVMDHKVMDHKVMDDKVMDHKAMDDKVMDHKVMDHKVMDHKAMDHIVMDHKVIDGKVMDHKVMDHKVMDNKVMDHKVMEAKSDSTLRFQSIIIN
ncbi:hypothetical protein ACJMK2_015286 [Sinanodonta woodiana]|uniref:Uncharacterized protein n=1 Tax=Sinanodonta woodiana TaxID=1069815 RepID=A0ABD3V697_SINWO